MRDGIPAFEHHPNSRFLGFPMSQNRYAVPAWSYFFEQVRANQLVEIGTSVGGFTCLLGVVAKNLGATLHTLDIHDNLDLEAAAWFRRLSIGFFTEDCFGEVGTALLRDTINRTGISVLLCDGGDKIKEFRTFAPLLKVGDYIAAHDWHDYGENCVGEDWPWQEIQTSDVADVIEQQSLTQVYEELFRRSGWKVWKKTQEHNDGQDSARDC